MSPEIALDFTEQLIMFEKFGNVYDTSEFVQAKEVNVASLMSSIIRD